MARPTSASEIARPLDDEIVRSRVIELLDGRWRTSLTLVTAPGGYGKTRTLAQAVRSNEQDPMGIDYYLRLRPAHTDPARLGEALFRAVGGTDDQHGDDAHWAERILDRFAAMSPTNVCLIVDDVHLLDSATTALDLLNEILRSLPTNSHMVLAGRTTPELALARLRADDAVAEIDASHLVFGDAEIDILAERHDVDRQLLAELAGWPALIRLVVVAGKAGPQEFLMQEIVQDLPASIAHALTVTALAGVADQDLFDRCGVASTPAILARSVPLMDLAPSGEVHAHDLWSDVIGEVGDQSQFAALVEVIAPWHSEHWRHDEAIESAIAYGSAELARGVLMEALDASDLRLSASSTRRWLELFDATDSIGDDDAELLLLRGWHERLSHGPGHGDDDVERALHLFHERGDALGEARASVEHAFRGFLAGDPGPVLDAVARSQRLVDQGVTYLRPLGEMTNAIIAELAGDFDRALAHSTRAVQPGLRREFVELVMRHRSTLYFLVGDGDGAVESVRQLAEQSPTAPNESLLLLARFANGDVGELAARWEHLRYFETGNVREDFTFAVASIFVDACLGLEPMLHKVRDAVWDRPRERMQLALCEWSAELIAGNEPQANARLRDRIDELGLDNPLVIGEVRRFLVSGYVVDPAVRAIFDQPAVVATLGPYHRERLGLGRLLLALRTGDTPDWSAYVSPSQTVSAMSLPWSVEIACGLVQHDEAMGLELADFLFRVTGARAQAWIRKLADSGEPVAAGAGQLLRLLPAPPTSATSILTQPDVIFERDGEKTLVSRVRVRQLLLLLILRESVSREAAMTLLWPDKDIDRARNNLRITLSHLRDDLEPDRRSGEPSFHLRQRGDLISLNRSEYLWTDLWQMRAGLQAAEAAYGSGDRPARLAALEQVARLWEPPLLADLSVLADFGSEVAALQAQLRDATVEVAEAHVSTGRYDDAESLGRKLLAQDPFDERAYAIVIAAFLGAGHDSRARQAIDDCLAMLAELDVAPTPATRMLLRRARYPISEARQTA